MRQQRDLFRILTKDIQFLFCSSIIQLTMPEASPCEFVADSYCIRCPKLSMPLKIPQTLKAIILALAGSSGELTLISSKGGKMYS